MELVKAATQWAKDEVFSSAFFILFGIMFVLGTVGFWQLGRTATAKAFIFPTLVAGILLLTIGLGLFFTNKSRVTSLPAAYEADTPAFVKSEIARADKAMAEYRTIVFKVIPFIIVAAALLIVFIDTPLWRAIGITTIAMMVCILFVDSNANARMDAYKQKLVATESQEGD